MALQVSLLLWWLLRYYHCKHRVVKFWLGFLIAGKCICGIIVYLKMLNKNDLHIKPQAPSPCSFMQTSLCVSLPTQNSVFRKITFPWSYFCLDLSQKVTTISWIFSLQKSFFFNSIRDSLTHKINFEFQSYVTHYFFTSWSIERCFSSWFLNLYVFHLDGNFTK